MSLSTLCDMVAYTEAARIDGNIVLSGETRPVPAGTAAKLLARDGNRVLIQVKIREEYTVKTRQDEKVAVRLYQLGYGAQKIGKLFGCSAPAVLGVIRDKGVKVRGRGRPKKTEDK